MSTTQNNDIRISTGAYLKRLREEKGLSISEVATRLYLKPKIMDALERDDYDALPAAIYIRGYLRGYAKVLDVSADSILALYDSDVSEPPEIIPEVKLKTQTTSRDKPVVAFSYLIVFILILLLFAWWQSKFTLDSDGFTDSVNNPGGADNQSEIVRLSTGLPYPVTVVEHTDAPFYRAPIVGESLKTSGVPEITAPESDEENAPAVTDEIDERRAGPDTVKISLSSDCWIEIYDANEEKIYLDLARAGEILLLHGSAPFSVKLGSAQGATVEFNGITFDHAGYTSAGIARFVLGEG